MVTNPPPRAGDRHKTIDVAAWLFGNLPGGYAEVELVALLRLSG